MILYTAFLAVLGILFGATLYILYLSPGVLSLFVKKSVKQNRGLAVSTCKRLLNPPKHAIPSYSYDILKLSIDGHGLTTFFATGPAWIFSSFFVLVFLATMVKFPELYYQGPQWAVLYIGFIWGIVLVVSQLTNNLFLRTRQREKLPSSVVVCAIPLLGLLRGPVLRDSRWHLGVVRHFLLLEAAWERSGYPLEDSRLKTIRNFLNDENRPRLDAADRTTIIFEIQQMIRGAYSAHMAMTSETSKKRHLLSWTTFWKNLKKLFTFFAAIFAAITTFADLLPLLG